jgi:hypothetical protein
MKKAAHQHLNDLIQLHKNKPSRKKGKKGLKKSLSVNDFMDKRVIVYPENRKWLGNLNQLVY